MVQPEFNSILVYLGRLGYFLNFSHEFTFRSKWVFNQIFDFEVYIKFL